MNISQSNDQSCCMSPKLFTFDVNYSNNKVHLILKMSL